VILTRHPALGSILIVTGVSNVIFLLLHGSAYDLFETDRYFIPLIYVIFFGFIFIVHQILSFTKFFSIRLLGFGITLWITFSYIMTNFQFADRSEVFLAYDLGFNLERILPYEALIFLRADSDTFSMAYHRYVENSRTDLTLVHRLGNLFQASEIFSGIPTHSSLLRAQIESQLISIYPGNAFTVETENIDMMKQISVIPYAFIYKFVPDNWRFQAPGASYIYFRNRPIPEGVTNDRMITLLTDEIYRRGAAAHWEFEYTTESAQSLREKIMDRSATESDFTRLRDLYTRSRLFRSADYVSNYFKMNFQKLN
jgi:hypothetical protein